MVNQDIDNTGDRGFCWTLKESYPLHFSENSEKVESGQLLQILNGPHPTGQETGEELGIFRNVFEAGRNAEINK